MIKVLKFQYVGDAVHYYNENYDKIEFIQIVTAEHQQQGYYLLYKEK